MYDLKSNFQVILSYVHALQGLGRDPAHLERCHWAKGQHFTCLEDPKLDPHDEAVEKNFNATCGPGLLC
jgi:hypothetical protein